MSYSPHAYGIQTSGNSYAGKFLLTDANADVEFQNSDKVKFGNSSEMQLYHDGSNSYLTSTSGIKLGTTNSNVAITIGHTTSEVTVADNLTVTGDFTVNGTTTTINTATVTIDDLVFNIAADASTSLECNGAGINLGDGTDGADASILYNHAGTQWELNKPTEVQGNLNVVGTITGDTSLTLDAVTISTAEIGVLDGVVPGTSAASKVMTWDGSSNWTAAGGTCANLGTVTTADIDGGTIDGVVIGGAAQAAGSFAAIVGTSLSLAEGNITNVGDINCDSISVDTAASGLDIVFGGSTATNKISLTDNLADALNINEGGTSYMKFVTSDGVEKIVFGKGSTFSGTTIDDLGTVTTADINGGTWQGTIDGAWTAAGQTCANLGTVTTADINGGTWQGTVDGAWTAAGVTCANLGTVTTADINGGTWQGTIDGAWTASGQTCANLGTVSAATSITSTAFVGPIDGIIGGNTPAAGTFTSLNCDDNAFAIDNLDVNGGASLGALADTDLIIVDDNADDAVKKCTIGVLKSYVSGGALSRSDVTSSASISNDVTLANAGAGAIVLKLPSVSTYENNDYVVKKTDATAYTVTIQPADADSPGANVDGGSNIILYHQHESNTFFSDGTNWHVI
jgi:hypothetical protein